LLIRKLIQTASLIAGSFLITFLTTGQAAASSWNQNNIIDENLFLATGSMSQADIQNFLNGQGGFIAGWHDTVDMYSNFTYHNVATDPNSATTTFTCKVHTATGMSAAQIIYQAATNWNPEYFANKATQTWRDGGGVPHTEYKSCGVDTTDPQPSPAITTISPKVILATLQKEQSLITATGTYSQNSADYTNATYPSNQYALAWAMGYGVPDSGGKNGVYRGFYMQVMYASWQLRLDNQCASGDTNQWPGFEGYSFCGGKYVVGQNRVIDGVTVTPQNGATDALYNYTPHFSGNQHFVTLYEQWFGQVHAPTYSWQYAGQATSADPSKLLPGQTATLTVSATNTGNATWTNSGNNPVHLGTSNPMDRSSIFAAQSWLSAARLATLDQSSVAPGQTGTFTFNIQVPNKPGTYNEYFNLLDEGYAWMNDPGLYFRLTIVPPTYSWGFQSEGAYTDATMSTPLDISDLSPGQTGWLVVKAKNTGNVPWTNSGQNPVRLGTDFSKERKSAFATSQWIAPWRPTVLQEASVSPGQIGTFGFPFSVPAGATSYKEYFNPLVEGLTWMNDDVGQYFQFTIKNNYSWQFSSQSAFTTSSKSATLDLNSMQKGQSGWLVIKAKNTGSATWLNSGNFPLRLATDRPADRISIFTTASWVAPWRPAVLSESSVSPGQIGTFEFPISVPANAQSGSYKEYFNPLVEGYQRLNNNVGQYFPIVIK
jgi:hypothetical protein